MLNKYSICYHVSLYAVPHIRVHGSVNILDSWTHNALALFPVSRKDILYVHGLKQCSHNDFFASVPPCQMTQWPSGILVTYGANSSILTRTEQQFTTSKPHVHPRVIWLGSALCIIPTYRCSPTRNHVLAWIWSTAAAHMLPCASAGHYGRRFIINRLLCNLRTDQSDRTAAAGGLGGVDMSREWPAVRAPVVMVTGLGTAVDLINMQSLNLYYNHSWCECLAHCLTFTGDIVKCTNNAYSIAKCYSLVWKYVAC